MTTIDGRWAPRPDPDASHKILLYGLPDGQVRAVCDCGWASAFEGGKTVEDFVRLEAMHTGSAS